jgi:hypothetical protein
MTAVIRAAQLPGGQVDHRDSTANVKASAAFRMDENLTQFSVRALLDAFLPALPALWAACPAHVVVTVFLPASRGCRFPRSQAAVAVLRPRMSRKVAAGPGLVAALPQMQHTSAPAPWHPPSLAYAARRT